MVSRVIYDRKFDTDELRRINRLRTLDDYRLPIAWVVGIIVVIVIFIVQIPFHGIDIVHVVATYGCIPTGIAAGLFTYMWLDSYIDRVFSNKWDPIFFHRSGHGPEWWDACDERNWLLDQPWYYGLSKEEQRARLREIDRKYGLRT